MFQWNWFCATTSPPQSTPPLSCQFALFSGKKKTAKMHLLQEDNPHLFSCLIAAKSKQEVDSNGFGTVWSVRQDESDSRRKGTKQTRRPRETEAQQTPQTSVCSANVIRGQSEEKHFDTCLRFGVRGTGYKQWSSVESQRLVLVPPMDSEVAH